MKSTFDELAAEADSVPVEGWDFSWLEGRATEERPSWGYQRLLRSRLAEAASALDIYTGGGEVLAGAGPFPPTMAATESWPPNLPLATRLLHPLGVVVVATGESPPLPFADAAFDLVSGRHPSAVWWDEIARALIYFLRKLVWVVPDFTVDGYREKLVELHERIEAEGSFVTHSSRVLIEARKPG